MGNDYAMKVIVEQFKKGNQNLGRIARYLLGIYQEPEKSNKTNTDVTVDTVISFDDGK